MTPGPQWKIYETQLSDDTRALVLVDDREMGSQTAPMTRAGARRLSDFAFTYGAASVRHDYDLRLTEG